METTKSEIELLETELLLDAIYKKYQYDFRNYAKASLVRRIKDFTEQNKLACISELIPKILYDRVLFDRLVRNLSITVTEMFRDPGMYKFLRENIVEHLQTYPFLKVWHAGCATGEEVYSLAIMLHEAGLLERTQIYATDFNNEALKKAQEGIYPSKNIKRFSLNYLEAGGSQALSEYFHTQYDAVLMHRFLKDSITFANHNLITDSAFGEMNLVLCRNVLIYFNQNLQNRVVRLLSESLIPKGYLVLGSKESLKLSHCEDLFTVLSLQNKIYQKNFTGMAI